MRCSRCPKATEVIRCGYWSRYRATKYAVKFSQDLSVSLSDQFAPFYIESVCEFTADSVWYKGAEVAASAADALDVVSSVYNYVVSNITYDTAKANSVQSDISLNCDSVLAQKKGICFDYAAVMMAMLRLPEYTH